MNLKVRSIDFNYGQDGLIIDANIRFDTVDGQGVSLNGFIKVSETEYNDNSGSLLSLAELAKEKLKVKIDE
jgi:hypothetical protein